MSRLLVQLFKSTSRQLCPTSNMYWGIRLSCLQALQAQILLVGRLWLILCVNDLHSRKRWGLLVSAGTSFMNKLQSCLVTQANEHKPNGTKTLQKEWFFWLITQHLSRAKISIANRLLFGWKPDCQHLWTNPQDGLWSVPFGGRWLLLSISDQRGFPLLSEALWGSLALHCKKSKPC